MNCRICGSGRERGTAWIPERRQYLCIGCEMQASPVTPRAEFDAAFWAGLQNNLSEDSRRETYEEFLSSGLSIRQFIMKTME